MEDFDEYMQKYQLNWRAKNIESIKKGKQGPYRREWILPSEIWEEGLWEGIRSGSDNSLPDYLKENRIRKHSGSHNLKSSWTLCANLYFPFRADLGMIAGFLTNCISDDIAEVDNMELEFAMEPPLDPSTLLGEPKGERGRNWTSPDIAFEVRTVRGSKGLILIESKFT